MVLLLKYVALLLIIDCAAAQPEIWEEVSCGRSESCECMGTTRTPDPICHFTLNISQSHTFTRYFLDVNLQIPGFGGRVMYFNETAGQGSRTIIKDYPPEESARGASRMGCQDEEDDDDGAECTDPITVDGNSFRSVITVNNRFPAPNLIVPYNAVVVVDVNNTLDSESTSIHWHGMHQMNTPWMDGVEHITQCGIPPASSFRYIFRAFPAGTHWYHSHSGAQRTDGLFGALIVKESTNIQSMVQSTFRANNNQYGGSFMDMPQNHTLTLIDWQAKNSIELFTQLHSGIRFYDQFTVPTPEADSRVPRTCSPDGIEVGPVNFWSGLINGRGKHNDTDYNKVRLSVFPIPSRAQRYRFRLIGAQGLFAFRFSIDEHRLQLIATDGHFIVPRMVDFIIIHSGERYDFIPQIRDSASIKNDYIIRAETLEVRLGCERLGQNQLIPENRAEAILHYGDDDSILNNGMYKGISDSSMSNSVRCSANRNCMAVNCPFENFQSDYGITCMAVDELEALPGIISEPDPMVYTTDDDKTMFFNFGFEGDSSTSAINGRNFEFPLEPPQLARDPNQEITTACVFNPNVNRICNTRDRNRLIREECRCTHVREIVYGQTYRFVFTAVGPGIDNWNFSHPVHLHGHSFRVTKIGFGSYNATDGRIMEDSGDIDCASEQGGEFCVTPRWNVDPDSPLRGQAITNAPYKDTVLVPAGGYAVVYFRSNNPGYWFLHCHIEVHQLEGMSVVINEARGMHNAPPKDIEKCQPFTWSVSDFLNKEGSPSPSMAREIEYETLYISFLTSAIVGGAFILLFFISLITFACIAICYCYTDKCHCCCKK